MVDIDRLAGKIIERCDRHECAELAERLAGYVNCVVNIQKLFNDYGNTIKDVIFNPPATIIVWNDGTKSVVKCQNGEPFDAEKGFALAYLKKLLGNDNTFNKEIAKWVVKPKKNRLSVREMNEAIKDYCDSVTCRQCKLFSDIPHSNACYDADGKTIRRNYKILFGEDK